MEGQKYNRSSYIVTQKICPLIKTTVAMIVRLFSKFLRQHHSGWFPQQKSYDKPRQRIKKQRHHFADKGLYSQSYGFPSGHVQMWELNHKNVLSAEELMLLSCGAGEDFQESLGLQGNQTSKS